MTVSPARYSSQRMPLSMPGSHPAAVCCGRLRLPPGTLRSLSITNTSEAEPEEPDHQSRYEKEKLKPFERHLADAANKHAFTFRPWKLGGLRLSDEQLVQRVQDEIAEQGFWSDFAEMAMGGGKSVRIDLTGSDGVPVYRVTAGYGIKIQANYRALDRALDMAALFADVEWDIVVATSWKDSDLGVPDA